MASTIETALVFESDRDETISVCVCDGEADISIVADGHDLGSIHVSLSDMEIINAHISQHIAAHKAFRTNRDCDKV